MAAVCNNIDSRGTQRGSCLIPSCTCDEYDGGSDKKKCVKCTHPPGRHRNLNTSTGSSMSASSQSMSSIASTISFSPPVSDGVGPSDSSVFMTSAYPCSYPGCTEETSFDPNTGDQKAYCHQHLLAAQSLAAQLQEDQATGSATLFTTPQWSWNTNSSGFASSQSDSSGNEGDDEEMDMTSLKRSARPTTAAVSDSTSKGGGIFSNVLNSLSFASFFDRGAKSQNPKPERSQSSIPPPRLARPTTVPQISTGGTAGEINFQ